MAASIAKWAEQVLRDIDEGGGATACIRAVNRSDGSTLFTWDAPFGSVDDWIQGAESWMSEIGQEWSGDLNLSFVAEDGNGTVRAELPKLIKGKQRRADGGAASAQAAMMEAQAKTTERILQSANVQIEVLTRTVKTQSESNAELLSYIQAMHEKQAMDNQEQGEAAKMLGQLAELAPLFVDGMKAKKASQAAQVTAAVKEAATEAAANGAASVVKTALGAKPS